MSEPTVVKVIEFRKWLRANRDWIDGNVERKVCDYCNGNLHVLCEKVPNERCRLMRLYRAQIEREASRLAEWQGRNVVIE